MPPAAWPRGALFIRSRRCPPRGRRCPPRRGRGGHRAQVRPGCGRAAPAEEGRVDPDPDTGPEAWTRAPRTDLAQGRSRVALVLGSNRSCDRAR